MRVLALPKYGRLAASTRQRFVAFEPALKQAGFEIDYAPLLDDTHLRRLVAGRRAHPANILRSYSRRVLDLLTAHRYDILWVHCELFPYLPSGFELLGLLWRRPIIYDFDDAIFHMYDRAERPWIRRLLGGKLESLLRRSRACCCGNPYLQSYAQQFCPNSIVVPTVVDTDAYVPTSVANPGPLTIGWIGSPSTWANVRPLLPLLERLCARHSVRVRAVGAGAEAARDRFDGLDLVTWSEASEISDVQAMDIGIMPLLDLPFQRGKSGYKLIQYMACGLPVVASPVGVNSGIVDPTHGLLATSEAEWEAALERLIADPALRTSMGAAGRSRAVEAYSLASQAPRLVELFRSIVKGE